MIYPLPFSFNFRITYIYKLKKTLTHLQQNHHKKHIHNLNKPNQQSLYIHKVDYQNHNLRVKSSES